jgi:hypothetical protein
MMNKINWIKLWYPKKLKTAYGRTATVINVIEILHKVALEYFSKIEFNRVLSIKVTPKINPTLPYTSTLCLSLI